MHYRAWLIRIIDGDTLILWVELRKGLREQMRVRLDGVDTPEMSGDEREQGQLSKQWVREQLMHCNSVEFEHLGDGGFGRELGRVHYKNEYGSLRNLSEELLAAGMAQVYSRSAADDSPIQIPDWN